jgi:cytochrome c
MRTAILAAIALVPFTFAAAHAEGDAAMGKKQFAPCTACHTVEKDGPNKVGPNLHGIIGKKAGTNKADFAYSDALKKSGVTWDEKKIDEYITKPSALIPGNKMAYMGVAKEEVRANIIAYLKEATK